MTLACLNDQELLTQTKRLVHAERQLLTKILQHLREVERRRLFSDLGYASLFEYAVKELAYSEGQAGRRIQAMRLIKEVPEVEEKIASGALSLSNISQAQSLFRELEKQSPGQVLPKAEKISVLTKLQHKSAREGQKELLLLQPQASLPKERERVLSDEQSQMNFVMSKELRAKLAQVRALVGPRAATMSLADLIEVMADISVGALQAKRFGKKRAESKSASTTSPAPQPTRHQGTKPSRYIPRALKHFVWQRDRGACVQCGTQRHLQFDHLQPVALGGASLAENLRLLCFQCNQRAAIRVFGLRKMEDQRAVRILGELTTT